MTVQNDLQKAIAEAESAKGTNATFDQSTNDRTAKQMSNFVSEDMDNDIQQFNARSSVAARNEQAKQ